MLQANKELLLCVSSTFKNFLTFKIDIGFSIIIDILIDSSYIICMTIDQPASETQNIIEFFFIPNFF